MSIGTIVLDVEKGVEVGASDILKFITGANAELKLAPSALAALAIVLGGVSSAVTSTSAAVAAGGTNIVLDNAALASIKGVWPEIVAAFATVGVKL